jgi:hypothetical protein
MTVTIEHEFKLTAADRCDRCPAQAFFMVYKDGMEMLFCIHHSREHLPKLRADGWSVRDESAAFIESEAKAEAQ